MSESHDKRSTQDQNETDRLIVSYLDGTLNDAQFAALSALLHDRPELLTRFAELSQLDRMIACELAHADRMEFVVPEPGAGAVDDFLGDGSGDVLARLAVLEADAGEIELVDITDRLKQERLDRRRREHARRHPRLLAEGPPQTARAVVIPKVVVWGSLAAVLFLGLALLALNTGPAVDPPSTIAQAPPSHIGPDQPAIPHPVATLTYTDQAVWARQAHAPALNARLVPGPLRLESGIAHIVMDCGAVLMLKGPAVFNLDNAWAANLSQGTAVARVPEQAQGFKVVGQGFEITDLGTEFAVRVDDRGVQCRVVLGEVELTTPEQGGSGVAVVRLHENRLVGLDPATGVVSELSHDDADDIAWALPYTALLNRNLVVNGGFEDGEIGRVYSPSEVDDVAIPGWGDDGPATVIRYDLPRELIGDWYPDPETDPLPADRGRAYFVGRNPGTVSQWIDLSALAELTDAGLARCTLSADLGGFDVQDDLVLFSAEFYDASGRGLSRIDIDPVDVEARGGRTGFMHRSSDDRLPVGARSVVLRLTSLYGEGQLTDAYADNIALVVEADKSETRIKDTPALNGG